MASLLVELPSGQETVQILVGSLLCWGLIRFVWRRWKYDLHRLPGAPEFPILGHVTHLSLEKPQLHLSQFKWCREFGDVFRINMMGMVVVVVNDPELARREVAANGSKDLPKSVFYRSLLQIFGPKNETNILTAPHVNESYRGRRKKLALAFSTHQLKKSFPPIRQRAAALGDFIAGLNGESVDVQSVLNRYVFDALGIFAFDTEFRAVENEGHPFLTALETCTDESMADTLLPPRSMMKKVFPFWGVARKARRAFEEVYRHYEAVGRKVTKQADFYEDGDDSIAANLGRMWKAGELSMDELCAELAGIFVAGVDTTAHTLTYALCLLAEHPHVQTKLRKEIEEHGFGGKSGKELTYQDLSGLKYLGHVVAETLRYFPAVPYLSREASRDMCIKGYRIPKGTIISVTTLAFNRAAPFERPDEFWPERWERKEDPTEVTDFIKAGKHFSFSTGNRDCIGQRLAVLELQLGVFELVRRFEVRFDPRMGGWKEVEENSYGSIAVAIDGGAWLKFTQSV
ncbi:hypothetical protein BSKO_11119 [Bryopsis sp. KO-2023]|nr:hypothetical protein BSKO_11119 [Bryopsis sp. KO-2023]